MTYFDDHTLDRVLCTHDVAEPDTTDLRRRLDARLDDIVADHAVVQSAPPTRAPRAGGHVTRRRFTGFAAAAVAAAATVFLLPGSDTNTAYASWTATPQTLATQDRDVAEQECRDTMRGPWYYRKEKDGFNADTATLALAERRGDLVAVLLRDQGPTKDLSGFCVVELKQGASSGKVRDAGSAGALGGPPSIALPNSFVEGSMSQSGDDDELISMVDGPVGENVASLTIHAGEFTIEASLGNGRYAAWWPGRTFVDEDPGPSGEGGPEPILTYDVTLKGGTEIKDATSTPPQEP